MRAEAGLGLAPPRARRGVGLTPMIDVVFLILVFFMLAARFGLETSLPLALAWGETAEDARMPRVLDLGPDWLRLDGVERDRAAAFALLADAEGTIVVRPAAGVEVGALVSMLDALRDAGIGPVAVLD